MTREEKLKLLRQLQKGGKNRQDILRQMGFQVISFSVYPPELVNEESLSSMAEDFEFIYYDKKRKEVPIPDQLTEEQEARLYSKYGKPTTEELIEYVQRRNALLNRTKHVSP